jgi:hypothetical protein
MAVEIDEQQLATLQAGMKLLQDLQGNPKTRGLFSKAVKQIHPDVQTPEDVAEDIGSQMLAPVKDDISKLSEQLSKISTSLEERDARETERQQLHEMESAFTRLRADGLQDEGVEAVKKLMVDRKIADPEAAYALFMRQNPAPVEVNAASWEPQHWDIRNNTVDVDIEGLWKNPDLWADKAVGRILAEERSKAA